MRRRDVDKELLSIPEFGEGYGVGRTKTYELLASGELTALKAGGRTLIPVKEAERWVSTLPSWKPEVASGRRRRGAC
jgi:excisionase family DNA binding protein